MPKRIALPERRSRFTDWFAYVSGLALSVCLRSSTLLVMVLVAMLALVLFATVLLTNDANKDGLPIIVPPALKCTMAKCG